MHTSITLRLLALLTLTLTACEIVAHSPEPGEFPLAAKRDGLIRFYFHTGAVQDPKATENPLPREAAVLQEILERKAGFAAAILSAAPAS
ncbi:MAG: hypothetical protein HY348_00965 [Nitrospira defluvii]|nr:hypothetical protein [Nitrospira defluvii]